MHYYLYKITNKINQKIYVGVHSTSNLEDGYMGSGKYLKRAIKKYGIENFEKEILETFDNSEDMYNAEKLLVTKEFVSNPNTYNLKIGGEGGFDYINNSNSVIFPSRDNFGNRIKTLCEDKDFKNDLRRKIKETSNTSEFKKRHSLIMKNIFSKTGGAFLGKNHREESKIKLKKTYSLIKHQQGENNSQYGKMWIHSLAERRSTRIDSNEEIPEGWLKGRKIKFD